MINWYCKKRNKLMSSVVRYLKPSVIVRFLTLICTLQSLKSSFISNTPFIYYCRHKVVEAILHSQFLHISIRYNIQCANVNCKATKIFYLPHSCSMKVTTIRILNLSHWYKYIFILADQGHFNVYILIMTNSFI